MKKIVVCFIIVLLMIFPASASDVSLNRWILNVTFDDDGVVEELIQVEVGNSGSSPLDGITFVIPASKVEVIYDFDHTFSSKGQVVDLENVKNGIKLTVNFNTSIQTGETWDGRIGFKAENFARKDAGNYSILIPIEAPQALISGKNTDIGISQDAEIRGQLFMPQGVEVTSVTPKPFRILFQNSLMVPTWTNLNVGDTISLKGSFSETLKKIADVDQRSKILSKNIREAKSKNIDVTEAETHLKNAEDYNTNNANSALALFWTKDDTSAMEFNATNELNLAEKSFSASENMGIKTTVTAESTQTNKSPGFGGAGLILTIMISFIILRKIRPRP